jgi:predicted small metal-binding protein
MTKVIQCPCGFVITESEDEVLIKTAQEHAKAAHGMDMSREQALAMAKPQPEVRNEPGRGV